MKPSTANKTSTEVRTWYGASGRVELHDPFWHVAGVWGINIPHPPLVNLLIRKGLPRDAKLELSFHHEFGHLQMLPFAFVGTVVLLLRSWRAGRLSWRRLPWLWAKHHAFWEILAESYVMGVIGPRYKALYGSRLHRGLLIFWLGTAALLSQKELRYDEDRTPILEWGVANSEMDHRDYRDERFGIDAVSNKKSPQPEGDQLRARVQSRDLSLAHSGNALAA